MRAGGYSLWNKILLFTAHLTSYTHRQSSLISKILHFHEAHIDEHRDDQFVRSGVEAMYSILAGSQLYTCSYLYTQP